MIPMPRQLAIFFWLTISLVQSAPLSAQVEVPLPEGDSSRVPLLVEEDTLDVAYFLLANPEVEFSFKDTVLEYFEQFDPARQRDFDFAHLGNLGSAHHPLYYQSYFQKGFDIGFRQFDLYQTKMDQLKFYRLQKAFTNAYYTQGSTQDDAYFKADFSRNFANGLNFSLNFKRINNTGAYTRQKARAGAFATGFWYRAPRGRYHAFITYLSNVIRQQDNGGIDVAALTEQNREQEFSVPVILSSAETRHDHREYAYTHRFDLNARPDSLPAPDRAFVIEHQIKYRRSFYKFSDSSPAADSAFYGDLQIDLRGLRHYIKNKTLSNRFGLATFKRSRQHKGLRSQRDLFEVMLEHRLHRLNQEPVDSTLHNLILSGQYHFSPGNRLQLKTYAHLGLAANRGDYRLGGRLFVDLLKGGRLELEVLQQRYAPSLLAYRIFVTEQQLWRNDFDKGFETSLHARYTVPFVGTRLEAGNHLVNNYIYFDTSGFARQHSGTINVLQLSAIQSVKLGKFRLNSWLSFQKSSETPVRLPSLFTKHSLYFEGRIFKRVMLAKVGFDFRINTSWKAPNYQPLIGQFHLQEAAIDPYPALDFFAAFKVRYFRAFLRVENLHEIWQDDFFYQTAGYPNAFTNIRWGISWQFIN